MENKFIDRIVAKMETTVYEKGKVHRLISKPRQVAGPVAGQVGDAGSNCTSLFCDDEKKPIKSKKSLGKQSLRTKQF